MQLIKLAKWSGSAVGDCPAVYVSPDNPSLFIAQGSVLDADTFDQLEDRADDETGVLILIETVLHAIDRWVEANPESAAVMRDAHASTVTPAFVQPISV